MTMLKFISRWSFFKRFRIERVVCGSSALVASSQKRMSGLTARARAIATRCFWPPERVLIGASPRPVRPTTSRSSATRRSMSFFGVPESSSGYATLPAAVRELKRLKFWKIIPMRRRWAMSASWSSPSTRRSPYQTSPESGASRRLISLTRVDFPAPLFPMMP